MYGMYSMSAQHILSGACCRYHVKSSIILKSYRLCINFVQIYILVTSPVTLLSFSIRGATHGSSLPFLSSHGMGFLGHIFTPTFINFISMASSDFGTGLSLHFSSFKLPLPYSHHWSLGQLALV